MEFLLKHTKPSLVSSYTNDTNQCAETGENQADCQKVVDRNYFRQLPYVKNIVYPWQNYDWDYSTYISNNYNANKLGATKRGTFGAIRDNISAINKINDAYWYDANPGSSSKAGVSDQVECTEPPLTDCCSKVGHTWLGAPDKIVRSPMTCQQENWNRSCPTSHPYPFTDHIKNDKCCSQLDSNNQCLPKNSVDCPSKFYCTNPNIVKSPNKSICVKKSDYVKLSQEKRNLGITDTDFSPSYKYQAGKIRKCNQRNYGSGNGYSDDLATGVNDWCKVYNSDLHRCPKDHPYVYGDNNEKCCMNQPVIDPTTKKAVCPPNDGGKTNNYKCPKEFPYNYGDNSDRCCRVTPIMDGFKEICPSETLDCQFNDEICPNAVCQNREDCNSKRNYLYGKDNSLCCKVKPVNGNCPDGQTDGNSQKKCQNYNLNCNSNDDGLDTYFGQPCLKKKNIRRNTE